MTRYVDPCIEGGSAEALGYTTFGSVCRGCGHIHKTIRAAMDCRNRHHRGCASQGGYSDRVILAVVNVREGSQCEYLDCRHLTAAEEDEREGVIQDQYWA